MKQRFWFFFVIILSGFFLLGLPLPQYAQQRNGTGTNGAGTNGAPNPAPVGEAPTLSPEQKRIEMEINTSTLPELAAWCRSLGLSEGGTKAELVQRLRTRFNLPASNGDTAGTSNQKVITIEAARTSEYFKLEVINEDYARLTGDVRVNLKDANAVHRIKAGEMLFNRTRNTLTATGGVEYLKEENGITETFKGDSITVNLDNWQSVFLEGANERSEGGVGGSSFRFAGRVISRNDQEVTVLSKGKIDNAKNPEAYWSLSASRIWLLPGSDFAVFNALLKVGEIPVMYIPFFYYPADEVVFHPVIGYRTREGSFVQTTTYLMGRPKASASSQSSLTRILGNTGDTQLVREGIFLRNTGKKVTDPDKATLKAIVDYYTNLGAYLGAELTTVKLGIFNPVDLSFGFGFSRTITYQNQNYTPFAPNFDGSSDWNKSNLFSTEVPFRYRFRLNSSLSGKNGSLSWNFPYYSDPWVDRDFTNRAESMDWVNMAKQGAAITEEESTSNQLGDYQWQLNGSLTPSAPSWAPYISSISIPSISSTFAFRTIHMNERLPSGALNTDYNRDSPSRSFFAPNLFTIYNISASISGTPLTLERSGVNKSQTNTSIQTGPQKPVEDPLKKIGVPRSPWETPEEAKKKGAAGQDKLVPPALSQRFEFKTSTGPRFSIDYRISPNSSSQLQFRSSQENWPTYKEVNWSEVSSILSAFGGDATTTLNLNDPNGFYTNAFSFTGNAAWRQYSYLNEEAELYTTTTTSGIPDPNKIEAAHLEQYRQSFYNTTYGYTGTLRPLYQSSVWGQSNFQYTFKGLLAKSNFIGTGNNPEWETVWGDWAKEKLDTHQFSTNIVASIMDYNQNLSIVTDLPPREVAYSGNATLRAWISETNARMKIVPDPENPVTTKRYQDFYATETLKFGTVGSLVQYMVLDSEKRELSTLTTTLALGGFRAEYTATRMLGWEFNPTQGWVQLPATNDQTLQNRDISLSYNGTFAKKELWNKRLNFSLNLNSRLFIDMQRYTYSSFSQTFGFTLGINGFLDLSLSTTSENAVIFRYFNDLPMFPEPLRERNGNPDMYNVFLDLVNSFRFDNLALRQESGFKMKNFRITATHHLGDWNALLDVALVPYLNNNVFPPRYDINTQFSFLVQWVPISEIKSSMKYEQKTDKWTVE